MKIVSENEVEEKRNYLTFEEMLVAYNEKPKINYLWNGIKEKSFGLVFGPSKSGKTIFCENLAMKIAYGAKEYFGYVLSGEPKKVLFIGLEEYWENRAERNKAQYDALSNEEKLLINTNYRYQNIDFQKRIISNNDWENLEDLIKDSKAELVIIDSVTRMNSGKLENSETAEAIMQKLREICYNNRITLICIHHTPKMYDFPITMDKIKGSSVFAQEADFAIGINKSSKNYRYMKNVFFRYAPDDDDTVKEFEINDDVWLNCLGDIDEDELLNRSDRRRSDDKRQQIIEFLDSNCNSTYATADLTVILAENLGIKKRMIQTYLTDLSSSNKINGNVHGIYSSINYINNGGNE